MLFLPQQILTVDSGPVRADVIVVLGGDGDREAQRPVRAAELFREGAAPQVLVSGTGDCDLNVRRLEKLGVPAAAITREDRSKNTLENAKFSVLLLRRAGVRRVILVTSWYHSRRALACFQQAAPDLEFYSCPSYFGYSIWKRTPHVAWSVMAEGLKLPGYWVVHGVRPFVKAGGGSPENL